MAREVILVLILLICSSYSLSTTARPLEGQRGRLEIRGDMGVFESLPQGPVPPTGHSGCTNDPNNKNGFCPNPPRAGGDLGVEFKSLKQGQVPPMGPSNCTNNPNNPHGFCPNPPPVRGDHSVVFESLPRGPVPPMGHSDCTNNPNNPSGSCPNPPRG